MADTIAYILLGVIFLLLVYGFFKTVDWYEFFYRRFGNSPLKAKVYMRYGDEEKFYDGEYSCSDNKWVFYTFKIDKVEHAVAVPFDYDYIFVRGRRKILVDWGSEFARPLTENDKTVTAGIKPEQGSLLLEYSIDKTLAVEMAKSIKSKANPATKWMVIILIVIGALLIYQFFIRKPAQPAANNTPPITQTTPAPTTTSPYIINQ